MPVHQIWSCQFTQDVNLELFYFVLILHSISEKNLVEKLSMSAKDLMQDTSSVLALMSYIHFEAEPMKIAENCW